mgnify:CR=1 FL=1
MSKKPPDPQVQEELRQRLTTMLAAQPVVWILQTGRSKIGTTRYVRCFAVEHDSAKETSEVVDITHWIARAGVGHDACRVVKRSGATELVFRGRNYAPKDQLREELRGTLHPALEVRTL